MNRILASLDCASTQCGTVTKIDSAKTGAVRAINEQKLDSGDTNARKSYIRSIVDATEADDRATGIIGSRDARQSGGC